MISVRTLSVELKQTDFFMCVPFSFPRMAAPVKRLGLVTGVTILLELGAEARPGVCVHVEVGVVTDPLFEFEF